MADIATQIRRNQLSPWRLLDLIQSKAREVGDTRMAEWINEHWQNLVPVVADAMEAAGYNVGMTACGRGVVPKHTDEWQSQIKPDNDELLPMADYDKIIVALSGGKDSVACMLKMIELCEAQGVDPKEKIELWHHLVDGYPGDDRNPPDHVAAVQQENSVRIGDDPRATTTYAKRVAKVRTAQEKRQAELSEEIAARTGKIARERFGGAARIKNPSEQEAIFEQYQAAFAEPNDAVLKKLYAKLEKLREAMEADVTPLLLSDAELAQWRDDVVEALAPLAAKTPSVFDWPCSHSYCVALAESFDLPIRSQWRKGGILGGILKANAYPEPALFQLGANGTRAGQEVVQTKRGNAAPGTRRMFPQVTADLRKRWCSAMVKIDVGRSALANDPRFNVKGRKARILLVTGERREESGNRAKYRTVEKMASTTTRHVTQYRAVIDCTEAQVWDLMRKYGVVPHPCYFLGFSRASCATCIFLRNEEWATVKDLLPEQFEMIARLEELTGKTIAQNLISVREQAGNHKSFAPSGSEWREIAKNPGKYQGPIRVHPTDWIYPQGAFRQGHGPT